MKPQLCLSIDKAKKVSFPTLASRKLDGVYCYAQYNYPARTVTIFSRTGKVYKSMKHLEEQLLPVLKKANSDYIIFEAYIPGEEQPIISGYCRDTVEQHPELMAFMHDCLSLDEAAGEMPTTYDERLSILEEAYYDVTDYQALPQVDIIHSRLLKNMEEVYSTADFVWSKGGEGLVLRDPSAPYSPGKRIATMIKVKQGVSYDLKVVGLEEGTGKYKGCCGALVCRWRDGTVIKVGSGLTDAQRKDWWNEFNYDAIVGKIVQVDAMCESSKGLLREPRFKGIRYDKMKGDF